MKKAKILFIEDEMDLGNVTTKYLEAKGFLVDWHTHPTKAIEAFKMNGTAYDLCLIDIQLPEQNGFELAAIIKGINVMIPFIFLTARIEKKDKVFGLSLGASDYVTKPYDIDELALRIKNIIARNTSSKFETNVDELIIGDISYNKKLITIATPDNSILQLTLRESELFEYFFNHPNRLIKKEEILLRLWGHDDYFLGRSLDVIISRLRKIISSSQLISINTVYRAGYTFIVKENS
jgi:DNA-binding response OmpR family regulator